MSREQYMAALGQANARRVAAADLRRDCRQGRLSPLEALRDPRAGSLTVQRLILSFWRVGPVVMAKALAVARACSGIHTSPTRRVDTLTEREILGIADAMPRRLSRRAA